MSLINYLLWFMSLNSSSFFTSTITSLNKTTLYSILNKEAALQIYHYCFVDKKDDKIFIRTSDRFTNQNILNVDSENICLFIGTGITIENIDILLPHCKTIFYLTSDKIGRCEILQRWYSTLGLYVGDINFFLLNNKISDEIKMMIFNRSEILINYNKKFMVPYSTRLGVYTCLSIIFLCMISMLFLKCGMYSTVNPIITEIELERFKIMKYKDIKEKNSDSCLICFEFYEDEEDLRILFCGHYFHQKCVDKWLCEQSSRCPYCRYTNKNYDEV